LSIFFGMSLPLLTCRPELSFGMVIGQALLPL
jgi:hypothetical protein